MFFPVSAGLVCWVLLPVSSLEILDMSFDNSLTVVGCVAVSPGASVASFSAAAGSIGVAILRINGAFGVAGLMRAVAFSDNLSYYKELYTEDGRKFAFRLVRYTGGRHIIFSLDGVKDRTQALALKGTKLYVQRKNLEKVTNSDEYYVCDLVGKKVRVADHGALDCEIVAVHNFGAGDLIEISYQSGTFMVPFRKEYFPQNEATASGDNSDDSNGVLMTFEAFCNFK